MTASLEQRLAPFFLLIGIPLLLGAVGVAANTAWRRAHSQLIVGRIVEMRREASDRTYGSTAGPSYGYRAIASFVAPDGTTHTAASGVLRARSAYAVGDAVEVLVPTARLDDARLADFFDQWSLTLLLGFTGGIFSGFGVLCRAIG